MESDLTYEEKPVKILRQQRELLAPRKSSYARFSGIIIQRRKLPGNERNLERTDVERRTVGTHQVYGRTQASASSKKYFLLMLY